VSSAAQGAVVQSPVGAGRRESTMMAVAVTGSLLVHSTLLLVMLVAKLLGFEPSSMVPQEPVGPPPIGIVPAKLVRLGEPPDPKRLPDRVVPALPTAPDDGVPVSQKLEQPPVKQTSKRRPLNPVEDDKLRDIFSRIRAFGEVTDHATEQGDPSGVPGGDVTDPALAQAGSLWARELSQVIKAYVTFPTIISESDLRRLKCKLEVRVGRDLIPEEAKLAEKGTSHNSHFDQAVIDGFEQMRIKRVKLPRPPRELEEMLFGGGLEITMYGRDLDDD
jgi:hypothetical protein